MGDPGGSSGFLGDLGADLEPVWLPDIYPKSRVSETKRSSYEQKFNVGASHERSGDWLFLIVWFWGFPGGSWGFLWGVLVNLGANLEPVWLQDIYPKSRVSETKRIPL